MQTFTWDDLYQMADGKPCGSPELRAKDNARWEMRDLISRNTGYDIEDSEIPEEAIESYLLEHTVWFDEQGHITASQ